MVNTFVTVDIPADSPYSFTNVIILSLLVSPSVPLTICYFCKLLNNFQNLDNQRLHSFNYP